VSRPPLLGVAYSNLGHWRKSSAVTFYEDLCALPQPTVIGEIPPTQSEINQGITQGSIKIGPMVVVRLKEGGEFKFTELAGTSLDQLKSSIEAKVKQMAAQGMSFLMKDRADAQETAEAKRLDANAENSTLATCAQGIDDCVNLAWQHHAWFEGVSVTETQDGQSKSVPVFSLSREYEEMQMDPAVMLAYIQAVTQLKLPVKVVLEMWKAGGRLPDDVDVEELDSLMEAAIEEARQAQLDTMKQQAEITASVKQPVGKPAKKAAPTSGGGSY
jgi:hypothetical protein